MSGEVAFEVVPFADSVFAIKTVAQWPEMKPYLISHRRTLLYHGMLYLYLTNGKWTGKL